MEAIKACFSNYASFTGRARRSEFWWFMLFVFLVNLVASILDTSLGTTINQDRCGVFQLLCSLALFLPVLAACARRMHDIGRSGWWALLPCAPLASFLLALLVTFSFLYGFLMALCLTLTFPIWVIFVVWACSDSEPRANEWGPSPKYYIAQEADGDTSQEVDGDTQQETYGDHQLQPTLFYTPRASFAWAITSCLGDYANFNGRARRSEFWWFFLFEIIVGFLAVWADMALGSYFVLWTVAALALCCPSFAVAARRMHDIGSSGWWGILHPVVLTVIILLIVVLMSLMHVNWWFVAGCMPVLAPWMSLLIFAANILGMVLLGFASLDSRVEDNKWGPSPKYFYEPATAADDATPVVSANSSDAPGETSDAPTQAQF